MIQLLGSFWGQPASAMKPGTLARRYTVHSGPLGKAVENAGRRKHLGVGLRCLGLVWRGGEHRQQHATNGQHFQIHTHSLFPHRINDSLISSKRALPRNLYCLAYAVKQRQNRDDRNGASKSSRREGFGRTWTL